MAAVFLFRLTFFCSCLALSGLGPSLAPSRSRSEREVRYIPYQAPLRLEREPQSTQGQTGAKKKLSLKRNTAAVSYVSGQAYFSTDEWAGTISSVWIWIGCTRFPVTWCVEFKCIYFWISSRALSRLALIHSQQSYNHHSVIIVYNMYLCMYFSPKSMHEVRKL